MPDIVPVHDHDRGDPIAEALSRLVLPPLPNVIRYHDDFADLKQTILNLASSPKVILRFEGVEYPCDFQIFGAAQHVVKHVFVNWIQKHALHTVKIHLQRLRAFCSAWGWRQLAKLVLVAPGDLATHWNYNVFPLVSGGVAEGLRAMLHSLAALSIGTWSPHDAVGIRSIRSPRRDRLPKLRTGEAYLSMREGAVVVDYLDHFSASVGPSTDITALQDATLLLLCYQHAIRPGQAARLERSSTKRYEDGSLHITVPYRKQRRGVRPKTSVRAIKLEWIPIFSELLSRTSELHPSVADIPPEALLQLTPAEASLRIIRILASLKLRRNATDLRHTGAQRLADAGSSLEEIMLYLCHESNRAAQLYIDTSPAHGRTVNEALGISEFFGDIPELHRRHYVDAAELNNLPPDRIVSGAPHGFLTGAVGGCTEGQSMCSRSPVLACYSCHKFMPTSDVEVHESLLGGLRHVVESFISMWSEDEDVPIFAQLRTTMDGIRTVIEGLRRSNVTPHAKEHGR
ncbi:hypothetical protein MRS76_14495 [Rhizobiaceae bacterium n13]|uniref:Tyr recombinase domain-containing protein n=1 Tax=Ferirhizobium litorale TaxID=2927786 RepID=A0AAE3U4J5_9HYPH|nr:tyrosine-type recombinase/integrase [Fererhizobium litorale]MDI7863166.1 hypothetical protein [Fererhizobium litorale]MDI7923099.1 hypothetical protein [Fererhizobium litorale]